MNIRPIRNDQDYRAALKALSPLFDHEPEPGTPEGDRFEIMLTLVEAYEAKHFPVDPGDHLRRHPVAVVRRGWCRCLG